jgi:biopolymer transport protein ExbB
MSTKTHPSDPSDTIVQAVPTARLRPPHRQTLRVQARRFPIAGLARIVVSIAVVTLGGMLADSARSQNTPFRPSQPLSIPAPQPGQYGGGNPVQIAAQPPFANQGQPLSNQGQPLSNQGQPLSNQGQPGAPGAEATSADAESDSSQDDGTALGLINTILAGGWLMLPLGICSLVVVGLTFERLLALRRGRVIPRPFVRRFTEMVEDGQLSYEEAQGICEEFDCPVAEVFQAAVKRWGRPMLEIEQAVVDAGDRVSDHLTKYLRVFQSISNVAPLIGLLGTVLGMIDSFEMLSQAAQSGPDVLSSGISTALITTAGGLIVAIPAYLAYVYFGSVADRYLVEIDRLCQRVIDCISAEGLESAGRKKTRRTA